MTEIQLLLNLGKKAVLGNVREFESNSNDIFDIIMRELENDK